MPTQPQNSAILIAYISRMTGDRIDRGEIFFEYYFELSDAFA